MKLYLWMSRSPGGHLHDHTASSRSEANGERAFQICGLCEVGPLKVVTLTQPRKRKAKK